MSTGVLVCGIPRVPPPSANSRLLLFTSDFPKFFYRSRAPRRAAAPAQGSPAGRGAAPAVARVVAAEEVPDALVVAEAPVLVAFGVLLPLPLPVEAGAAPTAVQIWVETCWTSR